MEENQQFKFPTETIELPSKGLLYPEGNPLCSGKLELKYMTAKEEDILTNQNYIANGTVLDKLLQSLIVTKIDYNDLLVGDKNAILIAARVLGYGKDYTFEYRGEEHTVDLTTLENKPFDSSLITPGENKFTFKLPHSGNEISYRIMDGHMEKKIEDEIKGLKKINKNNSPELTTRFKHIITSVNGDESPKTVREFVDNYLLARDSRSFREHIKAFQPDVNMKINVETNGDLEEIDLPIGVNFFFPDA